jgi:hypothetical protein
LAQPSSTIAPSAPSEAATASSPCTYSNCQSSPRTVLIVSFSPNASARSWCTVVTSMPAPARAFPTAGSVGDQPSAPVITYSAAMRSDSELRVVSFRPAATTVTSVTSATPMVSATAVVTVRPGWRMALRRASPPAAPPSA